MTFPSVRVVHDPFGMGMAFSAAIFALPTEPTSTASCNILGRGTVWRAPASSPFYAVAGTVPIVPIAASAAYGRARLGFPGRGAAFARFVPGLRLPITALLMPAFARHRAIGILPTPSTLPIPCTAYEQSPVAPSTLEEHRRHRGRRGREARDRAIPGGWAGPSRTGWRRTADGSPFPVAKGALPPCDLLVDNAGTFSVCVPLWECDPDLRARGTDVNLKGTFLDVQPRRRWHGRPRPGAGVQRRLYGRGARRPPLRHVLRRLGGHADDRRPGDGADPAWLPGRRGGPSGRGHRAEPPADGGRAGADLPPAEKGQLHARRGRPARRRRRLRGGARLGSGRRAVGAAPAAPSGRRGADRRCRPRPGPGPPDAADRRLRERTNG